MCSVFSTLYIFYLPHNTIVCIINCETVTCTCIFWSLFCFRLQYLVAPFCRESPNFFWIPNAQITTENSKTFAVRMEPKAIRRICHLATRLADGSWSKISEKLELWQRKSCVRFRDLSPESSARFLSSSCFVIILRQFWKEGSSQLGNFKSEQNAERYMYTVNKNMWKNAWMRYLQKEYMHQQGETM